MPEPLKTAPAKPFWESTTLWLNVAGVVALLLQLGMNNEVIPYQYQEMALALLNFLNRLRNTGQPLKLS